MITFDLQEIGKSMEFYTSNYKKVFLMGDFNFEMSETSVNSFCNCLVPNLKCLVQEPTCNKNPERPSFIELFFSNCSNHFLKTEILGTGLFFISTNVLLLLQRLNLKTTSANCCISNLQKL